MDTQSHSQPGGFGGVFKMLSSKLINTASANNFVTWISQLSIKVDKPHTKFGHLLTMHSIYKFKLLGLQFFFLVTLVLLDVSLRKCAYRNI